MKTKQHPEYEQHVQRQKGKLDQSLLQLPMQSSGNRGHHGHGNFQHVFWVGLFFIIALMAIITIIYLT